ncbi:uncharacterized protein SPSC_02062 [Sporisorium scitamineum]|uniref:Mig1 protein n=1 Tax=Sporisorium scitamineum TaxID=49012 RepID=A0A127ZD87_9BASI|nr:uncharacterized protein SPSC_02062 [Sporisorium scitamineum]
MRVASFFISILLASCVLFVAGLDQAGPLPQDTELVTIANAARGINFDACPHENPPPPAGTKLALVSISPNSGLQAQFWDVGHFDGYWLKTYLEPKLDGFKVDCWEAPIRGCAKPIPAAAVPPHVVKKAVLLATAKRERPYRGASDDELVPLGDPSLLS